MTKTERRIFTILATILVCALLAVAVFAIWSDAIIAAAAKHLPIETVDKYLLYDHIQYNGVDYYLVSSKLMPGFTDDDTIYFSSKEIPVTLVDKDGVPYDDSYIRYAWSYAKDPEMRFLMFGSGHYTCDKNLADMSIKD